MFKNALLGLSLCSLCCLPLVADSINLSGGSNWTDLRDVQAAGIDTLDYSQTAYYDNIPLATVSTNTQITNTGSIYKISGTVEADSGFAYNGWRNGIPFTSAKVTLILDLPASFNNFFVSGFDNEIDDDGYGTGVPTCYVAVNGVSSVNCNTPNFGFTIQHTAGTPISLLFSFGHSVASFNSTYREDFGISVIDSTAVPEPASGWLLLPAMLGLGLCRAFRKRFTRSGY